MRPQACRDWFCLWRVETHSPLRTIFANFRPEALQCCGRLETIFATRSRPCRYMPRHTMAGQGPVDPGRSATDCFGSFRLRFLTPHFTNVRVFETIYPDRHNLYFWASDASIPFDADWAAG